MDQPTCESLILETYRSYWQQFYTWKQDYSSTHLESLRATTTECNLEPLVDDDEPQDDDSNDENSDSILLQVTEYSYSSSSTSTKQYTLPVSKFVITPSNTTATNNKNNKMEPHSEYISCTSLRRSRFVGDDLNPMPFLPYSDDPNFNHIQQMNDHYETLAWRWQEVDDPDVEVICVQTVKRLMEIHSLAFDQIKETNIIPSKFMQDMLSYIGAQRRDYPPWPPESPLHSTNVPYKPKYTIEETPSKILEELVGAFCISDCHHGYCDTHPSDKRPLPPPLNPTLTNESLYSTVDEPCSQRCFILGRYLNTLSYWSPEDLEVLRLILGYSPDTLPCDLATIVRKPCNEVATQRQIWLTSQPPIGTSQSRALTRKNSNTTKINCSDFDSDTFTPNQPCTHPGPCTSTTPSCLCAENNTHCIGYCSCPKTCIRKWRGCTCTKSRYLPVHEGKTCSTDRCPCFRANRECDPILCGRCESRDPNTNVCKNSGLQHLRHKRGMVYQSKWGLGYYILEAARDGDLITEYIGDLIYDLTVRSRDPVAAHTGRQYMFKLNSSLTVDGTLRGNESRYINHATGDKANVRAFIRLVNSEHRIGIYAAKDINPGTELLLDYGSEFFYTIKRHLAPLQSPISVPQLEHTPKTNQIPSDSPLVLSPTYYKSIPFVPQSPLLPPPLSVQPEPQSPTPITKKTKYSGRKDGQASRSGSTNQARNTRRRKRLTDLTLQEELDEVSEYKKLSSSSDGAPPD